jgi:hypothetical protein
VKSGQNNKKKISSALETSGTKSHTKITKSQNTLPQLLSLLSPSNNFNNSQCCNSIQCCNSSQLDYPNPLCFCPSNLSLCHHNFRHHNSFKPHHCNRRKVFSLPYQKLSLHCHCRNTHQRSKNVISRPFQKRTRLLDHNVQKLRTRTFLLLRSLQEAAHLKCRISWDEENKQILLNLLTSDLETFLNGLPSSPRENLH